MRPGIYADTLSLFGLMQDDPLGLATPFTLAAKVLMRKLCTLRLIDGKTKKWDCPMSTELRIE
jgi:hypothetical protein